MASWQRQTRRLLAHLVLTVVVLAMLGFLLAQLATSGMSHVLAVGYGSAGADGSEEVALSIEQLAALRWQLPLRLAAMGVVLVLLGEGLLLLLRREQSKNDGQVTDKARS